MPQPPSFAEFSRRYKAQQGQQQQAPPAAPGGTGQSATIPSFSQFQSQYQPPAEAAGPTGTPLEEWLSPTGGEENFWTSPHGLIRTGLRQTAEGVRHLL